MTVTAFQTRCKRSLQAILLAALLAGSASFVWASDTESWGSVHDPDFGEILYQFFQGHYFKSIVHTLAALRRERIESHHDEDNALLLLGGLYMSYGMPNEASALFRKMPMSQITPAERDQSWYYLAKIHYSRNENSKAITALDQIKAPLYDSLQGERLQMRANLLIRLDRYDEALKILETIPAESTWAAYARYNLGIALIRTDRLADATVQFDKLGTSPAKTEEQRGLRDKSNLVIGYAYLQANQAEQAIPRLQRIRLNGPHSNKALLGLGWAYSSLDEYRKALAPWLELQRRSLLDPAVQESLLGAAYSLGKLGAEAQSLKHYEAAAELFQSEIDRIELVIDSIRNGKLIDKMIAQSPLDEQGWYWNPGSLVESPEAPDLFHLLASHYFQESFKSFRDLYFMHRNLTNWLADLDAFDTMLDTRKQAYEQQLPVVEARLAQSEETELAIQLTRYSNELERVKTEDNPMILANDRELKWIKRLESIDTHLQNLQGKQDIERARKQYHLLRGQLYWQLAIDTPARSWSYQQSIEEIRKSLGQTYEQMEALKRAQRDAPLLFTGYTVKINDMRARLSFLLERIKILIAEQSVELRMMGANTLRIQQNRLRSYLTQARFAIAQIHDRASHRKDENRQTKDIDTDANTGNQDKPDTDRKEEAK
ncbi:MAG TPA: tetratricopeptide repeat protein [Gammaproteobacteria bacterium]|nr:tetratricopeptide repeat protein [Gammaproteobacteria bacterium]